MTTREDAIEIDGVLPKRRRLWQKSPALFSPAWQASGSTATVVKKPQEIIGWSSAFMEGSQSAKALLPNLDCQCFQSGQGPAVLDVKDLDPPIDVFVRKRRRLNYKCKSDVYLAGALLPRTPTVVQEHNPCNASKGKRGKHTCKDSGLKCVVQPPPCLAWHWTQSSHEWSGDEESRAARPVQNPVSTAALNDVPAAATPWTTAISNASSWQEAVALEIARKNGVQHPGRLAMIRNRESKDVKSSRAAFSALQVEISATPKLLPEEPYHDQESCSGSADTISRGMGSCSAEHAEDYIPMTPWTNVPMTPWTAAILSTKSCKEIDCLGEALLNGCEDPARLLPQSSAPSTPNLPKLLSGPDDRILSTSQLQEEALSSTSDMPESWSSGEQGSCVLPVAVLDLEQGSYAGIEAPSSDSEVEFLSATNAGAAAPLTPWTACIIKAGSCAEIMRLEELRRSGAVYPGCEGEVNRQAASKAPAPAPVTPLTAAPVTPLTAAIIEAQTCDEVMRLERSRENDQSSLAPAVPTTPHSKMVSHKHSLEITPPRPASVRSKKSQPSGKAVK